jgi:hypothetical protein
LVITVLGVMLGALFTPAILDDIARWGVSLAALIGFVIVTSAGIAFGLARFAGHDRVTAFFCAPPGGLADMTVLAGAYGGDERVVALTHTTRVLVTVLVVPLWFRFFTDHTATGALSGGALGSIDLGDAAILIACAAAGYFLGKLFRLPAPELLGPTLLSAGAHLLGLTHSTPPGLLIAAAQVVLGASVGCGFVGYSFLDVLAVVRGAVIATVLTLVLATVFALGLHVATGLAFDALWLAFAPGGLTEMVLISLSMGIDGEFVSTHHIVRYLFIVSAAALAFGLLGRRRSKR